MPAGVQEQVAMLGRDSGFIASHLAPAPVYFKLLSGENIRFATRGAEARGYLVKAARPSSKYLFVFHEWWGLNAYIRREAEALHDSLEMYIYWR